jgi:hypothetical protein
MILQEENKTDITIGSRLQTEEYKMLNSAKLYSVLSDKIYTDKVLAPIRELLCNAYDAHVAAGKADTPISVTLPTRYNSYEFVIRDYGTGLSESAMRELYTTYGASNKNTSNEFIGCLGLGSKSPFAYSKDGFMAVSYYEGREYSFFCSMAGGMPKFTQFPSRPTTEPSGLKVSFTVQEFDVHRFEESLRDFSRSFLTSLDVTQGASQYTLEPQVPEDVDGFGVVQANWWDDADIRVLMGGVIYNYTLPKFSAELGKLTGLNPKDYQNSIASITTGYYHYRSPNFIVLAELGDIDIAASRERCEDTDKTNSFVIGKVYKYVTGVLDKFKSDLNKKTELTKLQKNMEVIQFFSDHPFLYSSLRDELLEWEFCADGDDARTREYASKRDSNRIYSISKSRYRKDTYERMKRREFTVDLNNCFSYYTKASDLCRVDMIKAVSSGRVRFVSLPETTNIDKLSRPPASVYRIFSQNSEVLGVIMLTEASDIDKVKSHGIEVTPEEELPKAERVYAPRATSNNKTKDTRTAIEKALTNCSYVDNYQGSINRGGIYHPDNQFAKLSGSSVGWVIDNYYSAGKLAYLEMDTNASNKIADSEVAKLLTAVGAPAKLVLGASVGEYTPTLLARLAYKLGYYLVLVPIARKTAMETIKSDDKVKHLSQVFAEEAEEHIIPKKDLDEYIKYLRVRYHFGISSAKDVKAYPMHALGTDKLAKQVKRLLTYAQTEVNVPDENVWFSIFRYYGMVGNFAGSIQQPVALDTTSYINVQYSDIDVRNAATEIYRRLRTRYPAIGSATRYQHNWVACVSYMEGSSYWDPHVYMEAMDLYYKKHNKKGN